MKYMKNIVLLLFLFANISIFAEDNRIGKFLIMGWKFGHSDSTVQTNNAVEALLKYLEAAKYQMSSEEKENPSCQIVLYKEQLASKKDFIQEFYIYINSRSNSDYNDRCVEINIFTYDNENIPIKYNMAIFYNNYDWSLYDNNKNEYQKTFLDGQRAYALLVSEIEKMKK